MSNAITTYDFTTFEVDREKTIELLKKYCKEWAFQLEACPTTGRHHFQGRFKLKVKERLTGVRKRFPSFHKLSPTSSENADNMFYVIKEDTRIDGPWTDQDKYIPRQVREIKELRPWQKYIVDHAKDWDTRTINIILDKKGNHGKSILCTYLGVYEIGRKIPFSNDFRDIMRMVMDTPDSSLYIFDIPRALKKDKLFQFYAGIEEIKNGYAYDDRYAFKEKYFDCPNVWIFTNEEPDRNMLSSDRWVLWTITDEYELEPYNPVAELEAHFVLALE